ncbi:MAG TPA: phosphate ABC transporter substrate-binding protein PstS [Acetobacteraceae bacterium]|jgi:phosphate transport system substrate-binding protein|nr:phosphate ABC transporter substrate-binding protein PstS [Acetobacteraceae bacterium]
MKLTSTALALAFAATVAVSGAHAQIMINGAGATFPQPVYQKWGETAKSASGIQLNYQGIGSGAGQTQIINRTVDFGASDAPVDAKRLTDNKLVQFPTVMGAVVPIVNLPGIKEDELKLSGDILADIYLGKITKWNDPKIAEINKGLKLPNQGISPVYRADGSGTTFVWTSYLSAISPEWKQKIGANTSVQWPTGSGAPGNPGVAGAVKNVRGGIGYVENAYATQAKLTTVQLRDRDGQFVKPTMEAFTAAASAADWANAQNYAVSLIDLPGPATWPIVSATFILVPENPTDATKTEAVLKFFDWAYKSGGDVARSLEYIPLPGKVADNVRNTWKSKIMVNGQPVWK